MASVTFDSPGFSREKRAPRTLATRNLPRFSPGTRRAIRIAGVLISAAVLVEFGFRIVEIFDGGSFAAGERIAAAKFTPGADVGGRTVNAQGYWDDDFAAGPPEPGTFRVALIGGEATLGDRAGGHFASRIERTLSGMEIDHFGLAGLTPADWTPQFLSDVLPRRPQLVLVCISVDDVLAPTDSADWLKSRAWHRLSGLLGPSPSPAADRLVRDDDFESFVRRRAAVIAACRIDDDPALARRRRDSQAALGRLVRHCRLNGIGVGLVLAPGEYQLAPSLAASYCRNLGLDADQVDLDLPQRRWTAYADTLEVAGIDLLPAFRGAGAPMYEPASVRWTDEGQAVAAETIGRWLAGAYGELIAAR